MFTFLNAFDKSSAVSANSSSFSKDADAASLFACSSTHFSIIILILLLL